MSRVSRITRRVVLTGVAATAAGSQALARSFRRGGAFVGGGGPIQTITDINLSGTVFPGGTGSANTIIGTATIVLSPSSPAASGIAWSKSGTDAALFVINSSTGVLSVGSSDVAIGTYHINIIATRAGYVASPFTKAETITGATPGLLSTNTTVTRPFGNSVTGGDLGFDSVAGQESAPHLVFAYSYLTATITGAFGNVNDRLVWAIPGSPAGTFVGSPIYLNGTTSPPGSPITNTQFMMPAVAATDWNPAGDWNVLTQYPRTTPVTAWELRFLKGSDNSVAATVAITIDIRKQPNPYFQQLNGQPIAMRPSIASASSAPFLSSSCSVVAGTLNVHVPFFSDGGFNPAVQNTVFLQYTIDDIPVGPVVIGPPSNGMSVGAFDYPLAINTLTVSWNGGTGIPDGTHALGCRCVDYTGTTPPLPYQFRQFQTSFVLNNAGGSLATFYSGPRMISMVENSPAPNFRLRSQAADFVQFPGLSALPLHATASPIPTPQSGVIPPVTSASSPFFGNPTALLFDTNFYNEGYLQSPPGEYLYWPRFLTTPVGGVFGFSQAPESGQDLISNYADVISHQTQDGARGDGWVDQISSVLEGQDQSTGRGFWTVFEAGGGVRRLEFNGHITTLFGFQQNRNVLPFPDSHTGSFSEAQLDTRFNVVGTIGTPDFGDLRGMNDGGYDPSDATFNTLYVANTANHCIVKITNLQSGSPTAIRVAGQDTGLPPNPFGPNGNTPAQFALNGGYIDGPATEFVAGTQVAHFTGSIDSSGVLTVISGYTVDALGGLKGGCPLSWAGNPNTTTGNLVYKNLTGSGNGSTWQTNAATQASIAMTASQQVALFNTPYAVQCSGGAPNYPDTAGTLYILDFGNSALRKLDPSTNMVTTLFGNQDQVAGMGTAGPYWAGNGQITPVFNINATLTWSGGLMRVQVSAPINFSSGFRQSYSIQPDWTVDITGTGNPNIDTGGGSAAGPAYKVVSVASSPTAPADFMVSVPVNPGALSNVGQVTVYIQDVFAPTNNVARPWRRGFNDEAFLPWPQSMRWSGVNPGAGTANRHLVIGSTWVLCHYDVDVTAQTIRTIGALYNPVTPPYDMGQGATAANCRTGRNIRGGFPTVSWYQIDCDAEGTCGPANDIIVMEAGASLINTYYRSSWDGTRGGYFANDYPGVVTTGSPLDYSTQGSGGHYPWTIGISRTEGRMSFSGVADYGQYGFRIKNSTYDIDAQPRTSNLNLDNQATARGMNIHTVGSLTNNQNWENDTGTIWPWGMRPSMWMLHGAMGAGLAFGLTDTTLGPGHYNTDSWDALNVNFPTDAALATFIQSGCGGSIPRPEITGDDLKDLIYTIRRCSLSGSMPASGLVADLPVRAIYETDMTPPVISSVSAVRVVASTTSITVSWTTDKPTYGGAVAGFASAHGAAFPYHIWAMEPYGGISNINLSYLTTGHSVTLTMLRASVTTYIRVIAKDLSGNVSISAEQTVL